MNKLRSYPIHTSRIRQLFYSAYHLSKLLNSTPGYEKQTPASALKMILRAADKYGKTAQMSEKMKGRAKW